MRNTVIVLLFMAYAATESQAHAPRWRPGAGQVSYTFTSTEQSADRTSIIEVDVLMRSAAQGPATLDLLAARSGSDAATLSPLVIADACRGEFGGDQSVIGRVVLRDGMEPHSAVPQCIPESLFGAVTDLVAMLLVQHPAFGIDQLRKTGDSVRFQSFEASWSRTTPMMHAKIAAPGGSIRLAELTPRRALLHWRPDPMEVSIARAVGPGQNVVLHGYERFALELAINPKSGALLSVRGLEDVLDLTMWMVQSEALPPLAPLSTPGAPLSIRRTLQLERRRP